MKQQIQQLYDQIHMEDACIHRIQQAMNRRQPAAVPRRPLRTAAAVLAAVLVLSLTCNTQVRAAVKQWARQYIFQNGAVTFEREEDRVSSSLDTARAFQYVQTREGRLYFTANGENLDITDQCSLEIPFLYTYTDEQGVENTIIVGGTPDNFGVHEFYREDGIWIGGVGTNYLAPDGTAYPWVVWAFSELDLPWSVPGDSQQAVESSNPWSVTH